jgi:hypothetical protein
VNRQSLSQVGVRRHRQIPGCDIASLVGMLTPGSLLQGRLSAVVITIEFHSGRLCWAFGLGVRAGRSGWRCAVSR